MGLMNSAWTVPNSTWIVLNSMWTVNLTVNFVPFEMRAVEKNKKKREEKNAKAKLHRGSKPIISICLDPISHVCVFLIFFFFSHNFWLILLWTMYLCTIHGSHKLYFSRKLIAPTAWPHLSMSLSNLKLLSQTRSH